MGDLAVIFPPAASAPTAPTAVGPTPRVLSKQDYLDQFGPANNDDLAGMVRTLMPGQVFVLPFTGEETAAHAKRRALKLIGANTPGVWKISVNNKLSFARNALTCRSLAP